MGDRLVIGGIFGTNLKLPMNQETIDGRWPLSIDPFEQYLGCQSQCFIQECDNMEKGKFGPVYAAIRKITC
jgi:hypothetical protein